MYSPFGEGNRGVPTIPKLKPLIAMHKNKTPNSFDIRYFTKSSIGWTSSVKLNVKFPKITCRPLALSLFGYNIGSWHHSR